MKSMEHKLENAAKSDMSILYQIKRDSIMPYVDKIWGWDESYQIFDFEKSFIPSNFKKIIVNEAYIGFVETHEKADSVNISEIHIIPDFQGQGIGSSIIKNIIADAKAKNKMTTLGCFKENKSAAGLYKRIGFKQVDETETHYIFEIY